MKNRSLAEPFIIIGGGGFGREVKWLVERINKEHEKQKGTKRWELLGFVDDGLKEGEEIDGLKNIGNTSFLLKYQAPVSVACALGAAKTRKKVVTKLYKNENILFPNLIDPTTQMSESVRMGRGNIICAGNILTVDISIEDFLILNLDCTVGHDTKIHSFVTVYPSANLSGNTEIGEETEIGTGCHVIQGIKIGKQVTVGAGAVVIRGLEDGCTAVGNPARVIK